MIKILLIEDNPGDQDLIKESLDEWPHDDFEIACVRSLKDAKEKLLKNEFDLVLTDLGLPDSSGIETFLSIRDRVAGLPVVILTGLDDQKLAVKAIKLGAEHYVCKNNIDSLAKDVCYSIARHDAGIQEKSVKNHLKILSNAAKKIKMQKAASFEDE